MPSEIYFLEISAVGTTVFRSILCISTAAWAIASRGDNELLDVLKAALTSEQDKDTEKWLKLACTVLAGGELGAFAEFPELKDR